MPLGLFRGVDQGGWDPNEFKFAMYTIVIGAQTLHATGYAMGITKDGKVGGTDDAAGEAVIAYFGDGATAQGDVNEAFVWASVFNAPIVFFCQNNQYAISEPLERQTRIPLFQRAAGFGFPGIRVDGNDVLATYAVTKAALDDARNGQGPALIEAFLDKQKLADTAFFDEVDADAKAQAMHLRERVLSMPDPEPVTLFDNVYVDASPEIDEQREQFSAYIATFEGSAH
jgi:pyruvate dehydrogenase E1 component alpha subunit